MLTEIANYLVGIFAFAAAAIITVSFVSNLKDFDGVAVFCNLIELILAVCGVGLACVFGSVITLSAFAFVIIAGVAVTHTDFIPELNTGAQCRRLIRQTERKRH